jgi:hypothetical protein
MARPTRHSCVSAASRKSCANTWAKCSRLTPNKNRKHHLHGPHQPLRRVQSASHIGFQVKRQIKKLLKYLVPPGMRPWAKTAHKRIKFSGLRYKCPLCRSFIKTFLPFGRDFQVLKEHKVIGGGYRLNAQCPVCGSLDRERLLFLYLRRKTDLFARPNRLLHVAPEPVLEKILRSKSK